jgi:hypothetical protein
MNEIIFKSVVWKKGDERFQKKCRPGFGCRIKPRSSCTRIVCATVCATPLPQGQNFFIICSGDQYSIWSWDRIFISWAFLEWQPCSGDRNSKISFVRVSISWTILQQHYVHEIESVKNSFDLLNFFWKVLIS